MAKYYTKENPLESPQSHKMRKIILLLLAIPAAGFGFSFSGIYIDLNILFRALCSLLVGAAFFLLLYRLDKNWNIMKRSKRFLHMLIIAFVAIVGFVFLQLVAG
ncbi:MAG: hypothetical protein GX842_04040, partial [Spirochaetales bacterium]|nr:hypothetical protein [Spirochaetales bacterium]